MLVTVLWRLLLCVCVCELCSVCCYSVLVANFYVFATVVQKPTHDLCPLHFIYLRIRLLLSMQMCVCVCSYMVTDLRYSNITNTTMYPQVKKMYTLMRCFR